VSTNFPGRRRDQALILLKTQVWQCSCSLSGGVIGDTQEKGRLQMQNPDLTKWLEMVWGALNEQDELKRDHLLNAADAFLQCDSREPESVQPFLDDEITAA